MMIIKKKNVIVYIKSILVTIGLMVSFDYINSQNSFFTSLLENSPFVYAIVFIFLSRYFKYAHSKLNYPTVYYQKMISILFAFGTWFTSIYSTGIPSIMNVVRSPIGAIYSCIYIYTWFVICENLQKIMAHTFFDKQFSFKNNEKTFKLSVVFERYPFMFSFGLLMFFWSLVALSAYPGVFMGDSMDQVMQYYGYFNMKAGHPVASTIITGWFVRLGNLISTGSFGIFLFTLFQVMIFSLIFAYSLSWIFKITKNRKYTLMLLIIVMILPSINGVIILTTKDILFSAFFLMFTLQLALLLMGENKYINDLLYMASVLGMMLFRYNTKYFLFLSLIVYLCIFILNKKVRKTYFKIIGITVLTLFLGNMINGYLVNTYVIEQPQPNRREILSLPFQQTARFINYHENELTQNDKKIINNVLDYDKIKENYNPRLADPVKRTHDEEATRDEMLAYFKLWWKLIKLHPVTAIEATMANHSTLLNIDKSKNQYYENGVRMDHDYLAERYEQAYDELGLTDKSISLKLNQVRMTIYRVIDRLPFLSQLNNYGFHLFLIFVFLGYSIRNKNVKLLSLLLPIIFLVMTLVAGPVTDGYLRYLLPIIVVTPVAMTFTVISKRQELENY